MADLTVNLHHFIHAVPDSVTPKLDEILAALANLKLTGDKTVGQLEDLMAVHQQILDGVTGVGTQVTSIGTEVTDLIGKLKAVPPGTVDLGPAITQAQGILAAVQNVGSSLAAIPPEPTA